jgi:heat shock protein HslJ
MRSVRVAAAMGLLVLLGACAGSPGGGASLAGSWRLTSGTLEGTSISVPAGAMVTLVVNGSQVSGIAACNQYGGTLTGSGSGVKIGALQMTEMACDEPVMVAEAAYARALGRVTAASRAGNALTLSGNGVSLHFLVVPQAADVPLVGTTWTLDTLITGDVASSVTGDPATLRLVPDGTFTGSTGCRSFSGRYAFAASGSAITVTGLLADDRACLSDIARQDAQVLAILRGGFAAKVSGQTLTVTGHDGKGLGYRTITPTSEAPG